MNVAVTASRAASDKKAFESKAKHPRTNECMGCVCVCEGGVLKSWFQGTKIL